VAIAEMLKVELIAPARLKSPLLKKFQQAALIQIEESARELPTEEMSINEIDKLHTLEERLHQAIAYLKSRGGQSGFKKLLTPRPTLNKNEIETLRHDSTWLKILQTFEALKRKRDEISARIRQLEREKAQLQPLASLALPLDRVEKFKETDFICFSLGTLPLASLEALEEHLRNEPLWAGEVALMAKRIVMGVIYLKEKEYDVREVLERLGWEPYSLSEFVVSFLKEGETAAQVMKRLDQERENLARAGAEIDQEIKNLTGHLEQLMKAADIITNELRRQEAFQRLGRTQKTIYLKGWVLAENKEKLISLLQPYQQKIYLNLSQPSPEETPPIALDNPPLFRPFELITRLYGLPQPRSLDPTVYLSPFFFVFVGLAVSEAGYGLIVSLASLAALYFLKSKGGLRTFLKLLVYLGVSNVLLGSLVGGWFGYPWRKVLLLDPLRDPLSFLLLALVLGFLQVWFGTLLNLLQEIKKKNYSRAIFVDGGWLLLLPSLIGAGLTGHRLGWLLAGLGALGIIFFSSPARNPVARFFGGLYNLYDISRYLADVLSYSRLLALGLATSVIAMVVNTLARTAWGIPWLGWLIAGFIFIGGHLFNLGISFLGGFVHSMRLQFVEFFSKFFRAGGRPFQPLALEGKYIEFE